MILADTSAWVEYLRQTGSAVDARFTELIEAGTPPASTEPVMMEVLCGARDRDEADRLRRAVLTLPLLAFDGAIDFEAAADVYLRCRTRGVTPPQRIDCMIAAVALRHRAMLLAQDVDFARIATVVPLQLDPATPR